MRELGPAGQSNDRQRLLLDFECLRSLPEGINDVHVWWDDLLKARRVGKRIDIAGLENDGSLPEPSTLERINHPNVVPVLGAGLVEGFPPPMKVIEMITPFYPRGSITDALLRGESFRPREAVAVIQASLQGIIELHEVHNILHRDMKSGNILLSEDYTKAKVADLGLACLMDEAGGAVIANNPTLYSPPELFTSGRVDRSADLYPLGLVLRELLGGHFSYEQYSRSDVIESLVRGKCPVSKDDLALPVWTPSALRRVIKKVTSVEVEKRYANARALSQDLAKVRVVDWSQVGEMRWEAEFVHNSRRRVSVEAKKNPSRHGLSMSVRVYRTAWRRKIQDVTVTSLDSAKALQVFDQASNIAWAR